ncbi:hypothetical protein HPG69_005746, partial [Diceros bicornis minor]
ICEQEELQKSRQVGYRSSCDGFRNPEPLSLDCGHSFCQVCIMTNNKESMISQEGESSCPVCRITYQPRNLRPNRHVANIVKRLREVKLSQEEDQKRDLCEKLQATLERLRKDQQEAEELEADIREEITSWKNQIQNETKRVQAEFNQMRSMLDCEEHEELLKLKNEEGDILHNLAESENELVQQSQLDVNGIMERSETLTLKKPKTIPMEQRRVFRAPDLRGILRMFTEFTDVQRYWVHMTLDPPKDKSDVFISADRRQVRYEFSRKFNANIYRNGDYDDYGVLGSPVIRSGKHYWEVDVSGKHTWILGVYSGKCPEINMKAFFRQGENYQHVYSRYQPRNGYWVIGLQNHFEYNAFEKSSSSDPLILTLYLTVRPLRIGIFLDYEAGTVSFFNVTYHGFLIYKFSSCHFSRDIFPYFNPMKCSAPITLCSPSS